MPGLVLGCKTVPCWRGISDLIRAADGPAAGADQFPLTPNYLFSTLITSSFSPKAIHGFSLTTIPSMFNVFKCKVLCPRNVNHFFHPSLTSLPATPLSYQPHLCSWPRPRCSFPILQASWLRLKYPHIVDGAIAASAPVLALDGLRRPVPDPETFAETVTIAAGPAGGAAKSCADNARHAFAAVLRPDDDESVVGKGGAKLRGAGDVADAAVPAHVARKLRVCAGQEPEGDGALLALASWARSAFDYLAMGNYPYATGYILNSSNSSEGVKLPPWPMRKACSYLADPALEVKYHCRIRAKIRG